MNIRRFPRISGADFKHLTPGPASYSRRQIRVTSLDPTPGHLFVFGGCDKIPWTNAADHTVRMVGHTSITFLIA
jgi:hypothetical protein